MRRIALTTSAIALFIGAAACSSTPEPEPVQPEPVVETNTAPVEPVQEETIEEPKRVVDAGPAAGSIQDFTVNVGDRVYFDLDQASLDPDDQEILQRQAAWLQSYPNVRILVAGNCDERGTRAQQLESNLEANLDASTGEQRYSAAEVGGGVAHLVVERGALRTERAVEVVQLGEASLACVTLS